MKKINILITLLLVTTLLSCATFSKKRFREELENLQEENISKIDGNYSFNPIKRYYSLGKVDPKDTNLESLKHNNAFQFLTKDNFKEKVEFDTIKKIENEYYINLNLEKKNKLRLKVFENSKVIKDTFLFGKYKNGMFYLDNKYLECNGIPFLFGGCRNYKSRVGLTKKGNLLINEAVSNEGAILLIIGAGYKYNVTFEYKRK